MNLYFEGASNFFSLSASIINWDIRFTLGFVYLLKSDAEWKPFTYSVYREELLWNLIEIYEFLICDIKWTWKSLLFY